MALSHLNIVLAKKHEKSDKQIKKSSKYIMPIHFHNEGLQFIHVNSILHEIDITNCFPECLQVDEIRSTVYSLSNAIRNKNFNYKNTVKNINTTDTRTY